MGYETSARVRIEQGIGVWYASQSGDGFPVWSVFRDYVFQRQFRTLEAAEAYADALAAQS